MPDTAAATQINTDGMSERDFQIMAAKLEAASAMLAALEGVRHALTVWPKVTTTERALTRVDAAIAAAKAAGIKGE